MQRRHGIRGGSLTKRALMLSALLGLIAWGSGVASAANILFNPNLDQIALITTQPDGRGGQLNPCPIGWNVDAELIPYGGAFFDGGDSEPWCNVSPPSDPAGYGFFFKPFQGSVGPPENLLSVTFSQDNSATPGSQYTLSAYVACEANYSGQFTTNTPVPQTFLFVEFLDASGNGIVTNKYDLIAAGMPNGGPGSMTTSPNPLTTPQYTAPPNTATVRAGVGMLNVYGTSGAQSFFADSLDLEYTAPAGSPVITTNPAQTTVSPGGNATLTVVATGATTYQWQLYGTNLSNVPGHISGATTASLTITGAGTADVGHYRVLVSNASGSVYSSDAPLALDTISFYPTLTVWGKKGDTYRVDYATALAPTTWIPLSTNKLVTVPQLIIDTTSPMNNTKFYRAVFLY